MFFFLALLLFYTPRVACKPAICEKLRFLLIVSFLGVSLSIALSPEFFFLSLFPF